MELPNKKYQIIYADPPWHYISNIFNRESANDNYNTLKCTDIAKIPILDICDWDCICFLWAVFPKIEEALYVLRSWGFEYKTVAFTWVKTNKKSNTPFFGMGKWTRSNAEICLLGTHGNIKREDASVSQIIFSNIMEHSKKPDEVRKRIVDLIGDVPRIELFARQRWDGWDCYGDQLADTIQKYIN